MTSPGQARWGNCLYLSRGSYEERAFDLARLQKRYTDALSPGVAAEAYTLARNRLRGSVALPNSLDGVGVSFYDHISPRRGWTGGGLRFSLFGADGQELAVQTEFYTMNGKRADTTPPFSDADSIQVFDTARRLEAACAHLGISPDLTTVQGAATLVVPRVIQIPQSIS